MKKAWTATPAAFAQLLTWLDEGVDSGGERYLEMRRRLVSYFDRKRCLSPDELADDTLNRVARRIEEEGTIADAPPARYCYIVAKFVFLEYLRRIEPRHVSTADLTASPGSDAGVERREQRLDCLDRCLGQLAAADRDLILDYYRGEERAAHRRELAHRLDMTGNALSIRACRIRDKLEACVKACSPEL